MSEQTSYLGCPYCGSKQIRFAVYTMLVWDAVHEKLTSGAKGQLEPQQAFCDACDVPLDIDDHLWKLMEASASNGGYLCEDSSQDENVTF